ncbi:MAG: hypothetical protein C4562_01745 [Actinobacteria bacterium]|nr:MAG: hypothetical protein C4562_01745 [Actinomycetota bacterium]
MSYQVEEIPDIDTKDWRLKIVGCVEKPLELSINDIEKMPSTNLKTEVVCLQGKTISGTWTGIPLKELLSKVKIKENPSYIIIQAPSGYAEPLNLQETLSDGVMLAYKFGSEPVAKEHGGPLRLVASEKYAYKSVKWVIVIELVADYKKGYWEKKGFPTS